MAIVGQVLTAPESGWRRYDDKHAYFERPVGTWSVFSDSAFYGGSKTYSATLGSKVQFKFKGTKLRVIATRWSGFPNVKITIDGTVGNYSQSGANNYQVLLYEVVGLPNKVHVVEMESTTSGNMDVDAIDIDENGELLPFDYPITISTVALKNTTTNQHYSLSDKTLIHLPSPSNQNMILHGIEQGKEIRLDVPFDKVKLVKDTSQVLGQGKTFAHTIDLSEIKAKKILL